MLMQGARNLCGWACACVPGVCGRGKVLVLSSSSCCRCLLLGGLARRPPQSTSSLCEPGTPHHGHGYDKENTTPVMRGLEVTGERGMAFSSNHLSSHSNLPQPDLEDTNSTMYTSLQSKHIEYYRISCSYCSPSTPKSSGTYPFPRSLSPTA